MISSWLTIFIILFTGSTTSTAGSGDLWRGSLEKEFFRQHWCMKPGFCELCKEWSEDPQRTARLWYQQDGIASIRASIVSELIFMSHFHDPFLFRFALKA